MAVTIQDVEHIAALAKLRFTAAEKEKFTHQMNQIFQNTWRVEFAGYEQCRTASPCDRAQQRVP